MEIVMTIVAWGMFAGMAAGAVGGWLVLLIAWLDNLHADGHFERLNRRGLPRRWILFRQSRLLKN